MLMPWPPGPDARIEHEVREVGQRRREDERDDEDQADREHDVVVLRGDGLHEQ
jgi:hypothetical protein